MYVLYLIILIPSLYAMGTSLYLIRTYEDIKIRVFSYVAALVSTFLVVTSLIGVLNAL